MPYRAPNTAALDHLEPESIRIYGTTERRKSLRSIARRRSAKNLNLNTQRRSSRVTRSPQQASETPRPSTPRPLQHLHVESVEDEETIKPQEANLPQNQPQSPFSPMDLITPPPTWTEAAYTRVTSLFSPTKAPPTKMELARALININDRKGSHELATQHDINKAIHSLRMQVDLRYRMEFEVWSYGHMFVQACRTIYQFFVNDPYRDIRYTLFWNTLGIGMTLLVGSGLLLGALLWMGHYGKGHSCVWSGPIFGPHNHCLRTLILPRLGLMQATQAYDLMELLMMADPDGDLPASQHVAIALGIASRWAARHVYKVLSERVVRVSKALWSAPPLWAWSRW